MSEPPFSETVDVGHVIVLCEECYEHGDSTPYDAVVECPDGRARYLCESHATPSRPDPQP